MVTPHASAPARSRLVGAFACDGRYLPFALLGVDLLGHPVRTVRDNAQWRTPARRPAPFRRLGLPAGPCFNTGVLLMDVARREAIDLLGRSTMPGRREAGRLARHDQALRNAVLRGDWAELSPDWNWQHGRSSRLFAEMRLPHVLYIFGPRKPLADAEGRLPPRHARGFAAFQAQHFLDVPQVAVGRGPAPDDPFARGMLWRQLLAAGRTARYLARFPTDLTVHG